MKHDIYSALFLVQSAVKNAEYIRSRLDIHLNTMRQNVLQLSDSEFQETVSAVMTIVAQKDKNLKEAHSRIWTNEISTHAYIFDRQERDINQLSMVTKEEFQTFFERLFFQDMRANRLDIHWNSQLHIKQAADELASEEATPDDQVEFVPTYET